MRVPKLESSMCLAGRELLFADVGTGYAGDGERCSGGMEGWQNDVYADGREFLNNALAGSGRVGQTVAGAGREGRQNSMRSSMLALTACWMFSVATRRAFFMARGLEEPWAMMQTPLTPRRGLPP